MFYLSVNGSFCYRSLVLRLLVIAAGSVFDIDAFVVMVFDMGLGPFVLVELQFDFLFVHDCSAGSVAVGNLVFAFVGVVPVLETALAADYPRALVFMLRLFHLL
jgi:hypothetical protein